MVVRLRKQIQWEEGGRTDLPYACTYLREEIEGSLTVSTGRREGVRGQAALREGDLKKKR
jgi:hypothetical protein